jgi:hypothetical protein
MKKIIPIFLIATLLLVSCVMANSVTRTYSGNTVTYTVSSSDPKWGATIEDTSSCFTGGKYQALMLSTSGTTKTVTVSGSNCAFTGNYQFGAGAIVDFNGDNVASDGDVVNGSPVIPSWIWIAVVAIILVVIFLITRK